MTVAMIPHLTIQNAAEAIAFYQKAFGAIEQHRMLTPGKDHIMHAEMKIGDSIFFLNDEYPDMGVVSPASLKGSPVTIHLQVDNVDALFDQAVAAGATVTMPVQDMFWGDRYGLLTDPFGHRWSIATKVEEVSPQEMQQRAEAVFAS